jgi:uncharacterized DUF497 family protein
LTPDYEWDRQKAAANRRKHAVDFADAVGVFDDPFALTRPDPDGFEDRAVTLGRDCLERIVVVAWVQRSGRVRLISARLATPRERRAYAEGDHA